MAKSVPEVAILAKWKQIRPNDDTRQLEELMKRDEFIVLLQCAFEAGRTWQASHSEAELDWPDYGAKETVFTSHKRR